MAWYPKQIEKQRKDRLHVLALFAIILVACVLEVAWTF
jgi:hypothetical protein